MQDYKINVDLPKQEIEKLAKQSIKEIVAEQIDDVLKELDLKSIIEKELNSVKTKVEKEIQSNIKKKMDKDTWNIQRVYRTEARKAILNFIQEKPLAGNVYLKIDQSNCDTDYDYD